MAGSGHVGKAGHLAVMSEFLLRGYNVAEPQVDLGDDIFVVRDDTGNLWRVQVKTAVARPRKDGYAAKVAVSSEQLETARLPDLFYVLAVRDGARWEFLVIPRRLLDEEHKQFGAGHLSIGKMLFTLRATSGGLRCGPRDWGRFRGDWSEWPVIP